MINTDRLYAIALLTDNADTAFAHLIAINPNCDMLELIERFNTDADHLLDD